MTVEPPRILRIVRRLDAAPERAFDAWIAPEMAREWLFTSRASESCRIEMDPRAGGEWSITDRREGKEYTAIGKYLEVDRPRRLDFTYAMPQFSPNSDRIIVEIAPDGAGCIMTFIQEGVDIADELRQVPPGAASESEKGWRAMFDGLAAALRSGAGHGVAAGPGAIRFERMLPGPIERIWAYLTDPEKRGKWLASGPMELRAGGRAELKFRHADLSRESSPTPERFKEMEEGAALQCRITRCEPPRLLSYTWGEGPGYDSEVTFELAPRGDGVLLTLTHRRLGGRAERVMVASGWHTHLDILADRLDGREPGPFWPAWARRESEYEALTPADRRQEDGMGDAKAPEHAISIARTIEAPAEAIYAAWTEPPIMRRWMGRAVDADVCIGGSYRIENDAGDSGSYIHVGEYRVLEPGRRIVQTFRAGLGEPDAGDPSPYTDEFIEVALRPIDPSRTELVLTNGWDGEGMDDESTEAVEVAWSAWLDLLEGLFAAPERADAANKSRQA